MRAYSPAPAPRPLSSYNPRLTKGIAAMEAERLNQLAANIEDLGKRVTELRRYL